MTPKICVFQPTLGCSSYTDVSYHEKHIYLITIVFFLLFVQQTACQAPVHWLKYTTLVHLQKNVFIATKNSAMVKQAAKIMFFCKWWNDLPELVYKISFSQPDLDDRKILHILQQLKNPLALIEIPGLKSRRKSRCIKNFSPTLISIKPILFPFIKHFNPTSFEIKFQ